MITNLDNNGDHSNVCDEKEIDLIALWNVLWLNKKYIVLVCLVAAILGIIFAISKPKQYTSTVTFTVASSSSGMSGSMGALASFAGINLNSPTNEGVDPALFSEVLKSSTFIQECFTLPVVDKKQEINESLYDYYLNSQKQSWITSVVKSPFLLLAIFSSSDNIEENDNVNIRYLTKDEMSVIEAIQKSYNINLDKKTNLITFDVTAQSPVISAFLADTVTSLLQNYVIKYKIKKAHDDLISAELLFSQAEEKYNTSLLKLAEFTDRNKNVISAQYLIKQKELQNEQDLAYQMYTQMAQQVQVCKMAIQDQKPVFSIIQPAIEPLIPSAPNKKLIVIGFLFLGFLGSSFWVLRKDLLEIIKG